MDDETEDPLGGVPDPEQERLEVLRSYGILGTDPEPAFDSIVRLATEVARVPAALLGFFDSEEQWFKAAAGWKLNSVPLISSLCSIGTLDAEPLIVDDASADLSFAEHPWVSGGPLIRFYARVTLVAPAGQLLGAIEVFDRAPHDPDPRLAVRLTLLRDLTMSMLETRRELIATHALEAAEAAQLAESSSQEELRDLLDSLGEIIVTLTPDGGVVTGNRTWLDIAGDDRAGGSILEVVAPEDREYFAEQIRFAVENEMAVAVATSLRTDSGGLMIAEGSLTPKIQSDGTNLLRGIFRDVSEQRRVAIELEKARDGALEAARLKSQFLTNVSHELRTPLHGIDGMVGLLLGTTLTTEQKEFALAARASSESLLAVINNIIHISQLEAGKLSPAVADFDLSVLMERVIDVMRLASASKGLVISLSVEPGLPKVWRGDADRLRQVLTNLIDNAVKFTEEGGVRVRVGRQGETATHVLLRFSVTDTGIGIPEEARHLLFHQFAQLDASAARLYGGMGIGLAISRQLVELLGGVIDWEPGADGGSTFWFTLPFEKISAIQTAAAPRMSLNGLRLFLIEDDDATRIMLARSLMEQGVRLQAATTTRAALERLHVSAGRNEPARVIIFDGHLPGLDIAAFAKSIRNDAALADAALVMLSNPGQPVTDEELRAQGITAQVSKPVDPAALQEVIASILAKEQTPAVKPATASHVTDEDASPVPMEKRSGITVLVVEDKQLNRTLAIAQLKAMGYQADAVCDGQEAVEAWTAREYPVILMDCQMPVMDGYEATIRIRRAEHGTHTWIVGLTANAARGDREKCLAAGMDEYLPKPTRPEDIEKSLARWFHRQG